ncbi:MAG TPA: MFS transporter [Acidimicrobiia bacterium]|nr:MFS transporter [Acidimicrobiia bacterium]
MADPVRNLRPIVAGQAVSLLGDYVALLALPLLIVDLTGSALDLGLTTAFETLPTLLFGFVAGVVIDRVSIKRALIFADLARGAAFGLLALATVGDVTRPWMIFAAAFLTGAMTVAFDSGFQAWMPALLSEGRLVSVNTTLQFARTSAWTIGPPLAGFLIGTVGFGAALGLNALTFVVSAGFIVVLSETRGRPPVEPEPFGLSFRTGISFLWREPRLRLATLAATAINLTFVPMEALFVLFAQEHLDIRDEFLIGWFFAGHALLGTLGVGLAPRLTRRIGLGRVFVVGFLLLGTGFLVLAAAADAIAGLSPTTGTIIAIVPAGVAVAGVSFANVSVTTLRQQLTPPELLGRVIAASRTLAWAGLPVGAAVGGVLGNSLGVRTVYVGASLTIVVCALLMTMSQLWRRRVTEV